MNGDVYRVIITAREKKNPNTLYVVKVDIKSTLSASQLNDTSSFVGASLGVTIPDLVNSVNVYDTGQNQTSSNQDIQDSLPNVKDMEIQALKDKN